MDDFSRLYVKRKLGSGMGAGYIRAAISPLIIIFLVSAALVFSLTFAVSVSRRIDRMLVLMGSGSVYFTDEIETVPPDGTLSRVSYAEALIYSRDASLSAFVKGVDSDYFSSERGDVFKIEYSGNTGVLNPVIISSSLASSLSVSLGDRFTVLYYEPEKDRMRPLLVTVDGIFRSIYPRLDSKLIYIESDSFNGEVGYELLLPEKEDAGAIASELGGRSYTDIYSSLYLNLKSSVMILYGVFILISIPAAFFSSDAAETYIIRDRFDLLSLSFMGLSGRKMRFLYVFISFVSTVFSALFGALFGIALSFLSPKIIQSVNPSVLDMYVRSFSVSVPWAGILLMMAIGAAISFLSIVLAVRRVKLADISAL